MGLSSWFIIVGLITLILVVFDFFLDLFFIFISDINFEKCYILSEELKGSKETNQNLAEQLTNQQKEKEEWLKAEESKKNMIQTIQKFITTWTTNFPGKKRVLDGLQELIMSNNHELETNNGLITTLNLEIKQLKEKYSELRRENEQLERDKQQLLTRLRESLGCG